MDISNSEDFKIKIIVKKNGQNSSPKLLKINRNELDKMFTRRLYSLAKVPPRDYLSLVDPEGFVIAEHVKSLESYCKGNQETENDYPIFTLEAKTSN